MGFLNSIGSFATWSSTAQINSNFYLVKAPLFMQFLDVCVLSYPDPLDLHASSYGTVPIYFFAGAIDYGIMTFCITLYSQLALIVTPRVSPIEARALVIARQSPHSKMFRGLLLISFALRTWRFGLGNIKRSCNFNLTRWAELRKFNSLILILCPALFWHWFFETLFSIIKPDQDRPWLAALTWLLLSGDWDTAQLYSGWSTSKGAEALREENALRLNETWSAFFKRTLKLVAFATPVEIFVRNFPYMVVALVIAVARNAPAIRGVVEGLVKRLRQAELVKRFVRVDEAVTAKRDSLSVLLVRCFRRGRISWRRAGFHETIIHLRKLLDANIKPNFLACNLFIESLLRGLPHKIRVILQPTSLRRYFRTSSQISETSQTGQIRRFRLLNIEPSLSHNKGIICNLSWYELDSAPSYTAISYVWGPSERNCTITLNGQEYKTTSSAVTALKALRSSWRKKKFWIDAICIDQDNNDDKAEQISMMADIYRNASQVTVWLGVDVEGALALSLARRLWIRTRLSGAMGSFRYSLDAPEPAWKALQRLLQNPWFQRSWVVQEVMSNNVIVQYGDAKISWTILSRFAMAVEIDEQSMNKLYSLADNTDRSSSLASALKIKYIHIMEEFRSMHARKDQHLSLLFYLIRMFRSRCRFQATYTQDRIYALLNLCGLASDPDFRPDYNIDISRFFTAVARHFLFSGPENRRLDFLTHAGTGHTHGHKRIPNLPSWVPDWSLQNPSSLPLIGNDGTLELLQHSRLKGILEDVADMQSYDDISFSGRPKQKEALEKLNSMAKEMNERTLYRATGEALPNFTYHEDPDNILELQGVLLDRLKIIGDAFPALTPGPTSLSSLDQLRRMAVTLLSWNQLATASFHLAQATNSATTPLDHQISYERTLLADLSHPTFDFTLPSSPVRPAPPKKLVDLEKHIRVLICLGVGAITTDLVNNDEFSRKRFEEFDTHIRTVCAGRVFGVTERGRLGLFIQGCKEGDEICLFEGAGLPFVVRGVGETVMEGEKESLVGKESVQEENDRNGNQHEEKVMAVETRPLYELVGAAYIHGIMDGEGMDGMGKATRFLLK